MVLQELMERGMLKIQGEPILDHNNRSTHVEIFLDVYYQAPDGTVGDWMDESFTAPPPTHHASDNLGYMYEELDESDSRSVYSENFQMMTKGHHGSSLSLSSQKSSKSLLGKLKRGRKKKGKEEKYEADYGIGTIGSEYHHGN
ncbi:uncharacterized protein, partial [Diadema antillarum]